MKRKAKLEENQEDKKNSKLSFKLNEFDAIKCQLMHRNQILFVTKKKKDVQMATKT